MFKKPCSPFPTGFEGLLPPIGPGRGLRGHELLRKMKGILRNTKWSPTPCLWSDSLIFYWITMDILWYFELMYIRHYLVTFPNSLCEQYLILDPIYWCYWGYFRLNKHFFSLVQFYCRVNVAVKIIHSFAVPCSIDSSTFGKKLLKVVHASSIRQVCRYPGMLV